MKAITNDIINIVKELDDFIKKDIELPVQFAWDLDDNYEEMKKIVVKYEKYKNDILQKLASDEKVIQEGDVIKAKEGCEQEFQNAVTRINEMLSMEHEIEIKKVNISTLPQMISSKDLKALKFMIER